MEYSVVTLWLLLCPCWSSKYKTTALKTLQISMFHELKKITTVIQVWNSMRVSKWWQNINFGWTIPCKTQNTKNNKQLQTSGPLELFHLAGLWLKAAGTLKLIRINYITQPLQGQSECRMNYNPLRRKFPGCSGFWLSYAMRKLNLYLIDRNWPLANPLPWHNTPISLTHTQPRACGKHGGRIKEDCVWRWYIIEGECHNLNLGKIKNESRSVWLDQTICD